MNEYLIIAKEWWHNLQTRERLYLICGSSIVAVMLFWGMIWDPLVKGIDKYETTIARDQDDLIWMQKAAQQIQSSQGAQPNRRHSNQSLLALLEERISSLGLKPSLQRMNPDGVNQIKFWINAGSFDQLVKLFGELEQQYGVTVSAMSITSTEEPGLVDARVTVVRGSS